MSWKFGSKTILIQNEKYPNGIVNLGSGFGISGILSHFHRRGWQVIFAGILERRRYLLVADLISMWNDLTNG